MVERLFGDGSVGAWSYFYGHCWDIFFGSAAASTVKTDGNQRAKVEFLASTVPHRPHDDEDTTTYFVSPISKRICSKYALRLVSIGGRVYSHYYMTSIPDSKWQGPSGLANGRSYATKTGPYIHSSLDNSGLHPTPVHACTGSTRFPGHICRHCSSSSMSA